MIHLYFRNSFIYNIWDSIRLFFFPRTGFRTTRIHPLLSRWPGWSVHMRASSPIWGSLARTCERGAEGPFPCPSLARSRETGFAPPNRRACSQANMAKFPARLSRSRFEKPRSRQPSQPALSYKHIENFTKNLEIRRDLGNRASPVNRAHVKMPVGTLRRILGRL